MLVFFIFLPSAQANQIIRDVSLTKESFTPSDGEQIQLSYELNRPDRVRIRVYDPDRRLVRSLLDDVPQNAGHHEVAWDGRDMDGRLVPNEAYTFIIELASGEIYDPTTFSGGEVRNITQVRFDRDGTLTYKLPDAARVLIRLGIHNGPMLKTLVHWKPRMAGTVTEYWDGRDEDDLMRLRDHQDFMALVTYVTLPESTVITDGNEHQTYREYKLGSARHRPVKPDRLQQLDNTVRNRPKHLIPPAWVRAPRVQLIFPSFDGQDPKQAPDVKDSIAVRVDAPAADRRRLVEDRFEIMFYVNNVYVAEAEEADLPFDWEWELQQLPPGEHILTVNVLSIGGLVGVASRTVRVHEAGRP